MKNFFRKVSFGIGPNEQVPADPLKWALDQVNDVPELSWKGKIYSEKELRKHYRDYVYGDRKVLRIKYKDNKTLYKTHKKKNTKIEILKKSGFGGVLGQFGVRIRILREKCYIELGSDPFFIDF